MPWQEQIIRDVFGIVGTDGKHPALDWNMRNLIVETDAAGNIKPSKHRGPREVRALTSWGGQKSAEKIDGAVAMVVGFARATVDGGI